MCGIAGIVANQAVCYKKEIGAMTASLHHRGPDEKGAHYFDNCALGHTRLSIVDLEGGKQPMLNNDGTVGVTFNGEIYGFREIKRNLDYQFRHHSDTEVILALYQQYNFNMLERLPGMFSFAIWDDKEGVLFCARDRFGEKPFYFAFGENGEFIFASEIKGILATRMVQPEINRNAMAHYLKKLYVPVTETIYNNIYVLPPAHSLIYKNGKYDMKRYWKLPIMRNFISVNDAVKEFQFLFKQAIERQLVADVEVAALLSGGLDSSTIVATVTESQGRIKTFSFGFEGDTNELPYAREVAERYQTDHIELVDENLKLDELLYKMQWIYDEPFADSSNIPTYLISKRVSEYVKVVISGDGGDELLAGYTNRYRPFYNMYKTQQTEQPLRMILYYVFRLLRKSGFVWPDTESFILGYPFTRRYKSIKEAYWAEYRFFLDNEISNFGLDVPSEKVDFEEDNTFNDALHLDLLDYFPGDILTKTDRASMANSLEIRTPFLDVDFASFCISLPFSMKITSSKEKDILRKVFSTKWPVSLHDRPKLGFAAPVHIWLKRPELKALKVDYLEKNIELFQEFLNPSAVKKYFSEDSIKTWTLLNLALWIDANRISI